MWVDDPYFSLDHHLRHSAVPPPGTEAQLRATAARVFSQHLDRARPLWELWMVEGLEEGRWALLSRSTTAWSTGSPPPTLMSLMFGDIDEPANTDAWQPDPEPSRLELIAYSGRHRMLDPAAQVRAGLDALEMLQGMAGTARALATAVAPDPASRPVADQADRPTSRLELGQGPAQRGRASAPRSVAPSMMSC